ncbi:hypothetical protein VKT23_006079 [Stygiomarasmius scandens]|uniref:Uncharacterized protein n=1 Tax=Marasmiellus scandens TaxID=2682957 RepID=A0ABR1JPU0_9AGAR
MDMYQYVKENAKDAWNELKTKYGTPSINLIVQKLVNLLKFHIPNKSNPVLAVDKFKESYDDIFEKDVIEISELIRVVFALNALPNSWDSFKQQKMATDIKTLTFNQLRNAISDEYERRRAFNDPNNQNIQQVAANEAKFSGIKHGSSSHSWRNQRDTSQTPGNNQNQGGFNANSNANNKGKQHFQSAPPSQNTSNSNPQNKNQNKSKKPYKKWNKRRGQGGQAANNATIDDPDFGEIPVACMASIDTPDDPSELPQNAFEPTTSSNNQNPRFYSYCMNGHLNRSENATHCHFGHQIRVRANRWLSSTERSHMHIVTNVTNHPVQTVPYQYLISPPPEVASETVHYELRRQRTLHNVRGTGRPRTNFTHRPQERVLTRHEAREHWEQRQSQNRLNYR